MTDFRKEAEEALTMRDGVLVCGFMIPNVETALRSAYRAGLLRAAEIVGNEYPTAVGAYSRLRREAEEK